MNLLNSFLTPFFADIYRLDPAISPVSTNSDAWNSTNKPLGLVFARQLQHL